MQERKSPIVDSVPFTVIKEHSRTLATKDLLFLQREAVSSMEMLDCGVDFWDMSGRRAPEGGKLACSDR